MSARLTVLVAAMAVTLSVGAALAAPEVTYPSAAGITWRVGDGPEITWTGFPGTHVCIGLYKPGGILARTIAANASNSGSYFWKWVPHDLEFADDYRIWITDPDNARIMDFSDNQFTIAAAPVVTYPSDRGITWVHNSHYTIRWEHFPGADVCIDLYERGGLERTLASSTPNDGSFEWKVRDSVGHGNEFEIRVASLSDPGASDRSNYRFEIVRGPSVYVPNTGCYIWFPGQDADVMWARFDGDTVRVQLYKGGEMHAVIDPRAENDGELTWRVPEAQTIGMDYRVRIASTSVAGQWDQSNEDFAIGPQGQVMNPNAPSLRYDYHQRLTLSWHRFLGDTVRIELMRYDRPVLTIAENEPNDTTRLWRVPPDLPVGGGYKVRVSSETYHDQVDSSDHLFSIRNRPKITNPDRPGLSVSRKNFLPITWRGFRGDRVRIDLYRQGAYDRTIRIDAENDGLVVWRPGMSHSLGHSYTIRMQSLDYPDDVQTTVHPFKIGK